MTVEGKGRVVNLKIKWTGTPPPNLRESGDKLFEASRAAALAKFKELQAGVADLETTAYHTRKLVQIKTGKQPTFAKIADLASHWRKLSRETQPTEGWLKWCDTVFNRFTEATPATYLHEVTPDQATAYAEKLRQDFTRKTAGGAAGLLKSAFARLLPTGMPNPWATRISRRGRGATNGDTVHRRPLTTTELTTLFDTARPDPMLYALTVCAACTGMRIGDVCLLQWSSVDFRAGVISVRTSKTGAQVEIPIFKPLRKVLEVALAEKEVSPYIWPDAARMYEKNLTGITYRGKVLFARAFAKKAEPPQDVPQSGQIEAHKQDLSKILPRVLEAVQGAGFAKAKQVRITDTLTRVASGQSYREIATETGRKRSIISQDLQEAERVSGFILRRGATVKNGRDLKTLIGATRQKRGDGSKLRAASVLGWHSLRGTFCTLGLAAGIPIETLKLITGHTTTATIQKHYNNPQREHLREILGDKLPEVLTGQKEEKTKQKKAQMKQLADQIKGMTKAERKKLAKLIGDK
ncbi:MAG: site-specific integrase [bacterium]